MVLSKQKVVDEIKFLESLLRSTGIKDFIVTGGSSLLLRGIYVETDDVDIIVAGKKDLLAKLWHILFERKQKNEVGILMYLPDMLYFSHNEIKINILLPEGYNLKDLHNFDLVHIADIDVKVRKLESLKRDMTEKIERLLSHADLGAPESIKKIRATAERIVHLIEQGHFKNE